MSDIRKHSEMQRFRLDLTVYNACDLWNILLIIYNGILLLLVLLLILLLDNVKLLLIHVVVVVSVVIVVYIFDPIFFENWS